MRSEMLYSGFIRSVEKYPDNIALVQGNTRINYLQLAQMSINLYQKISSENIQLDETISVFIDKDWMQVVAVLGILFSGAAYLPIHTDFPEDRIKSLLNFSGSRIIITQNKYLKYLKDLNNKQILISIEEINNLSHQYHSSKLNELLQNISVGKKPIDLAYVIYTSGSTGEPKGVAIQHDSVINTIEDINSRFDVNQHDSILALSNLNFDLSVYDIFGLLSVGGKIVIPSLAQHLEPLAWLKLIIAEDITLWNTVPAFLQMLIEFCSNHLPHNLRLYMLSGDWIPIELVKKIQAKKSPIARLISLGGATEASIWSILYEINDIHPEWKSIPYGFAMQNQTVSVLDENLSECKDNQIGEIFIGGKGLAREYYKDPENTQASFIVHPTTQERLYKTGDYGRYFENSNRLIEFLGRKDSQIKINGYRIEIAEIEKYLLYDEKIKRVYVLEYDKKLYAFCEIGTVKIDLNNYKNMLASKLPVYMLPTDIFLIEQFPLNANGKIDKIKMKEKYLSKNIPKSLTQNELYSIWQEVLDYHPVHARDDFFEVGGDSLRAASLISKINRKYNLDLPLALLYQERTLEKLEIILEKTQNIRQSNHGMIKLAEHHKKNIFLFHPVTGQIFCYKLLANNLSNNFDVYAIEAKITDKPFSIHSAATEYANSIQHIQPQGPYVLAGWSIGGLIAYETAIILGAENIKFLGIFDTYPPMDAMLSSSLQLSTPKLIKTILKYYFQEVTKVIDISPEQTINFDELSRLEPFRSIDFILNTVISKTICDENNIDFLRDFTNQFKKILMAMINYKPQSKIIKKATFIKSTSMPIEIAQLWQSFIIDSIQFDQTDADHIQMLDANNIDQFCFILRKYL